MNKINMILAGKAISNMFHRVGFQEIDEEERLLAAGMKFVSEYNAIVKNHEYRLVGTAESTEETE